MNYFAGIDIGSSATKAVIINAARDVIGHAVIDSGADFETAAKRVLAEAGERAGCDAKDQFVIVTTGYGRRNFESANATRTEISCHAEEAIITSHGPTRLSTSGARTARSYGSMIMGRE